MRGRGAVDLVGQKHVGEDGARQELERAGVLVEHAEPGDVARQQVRSALDPRKLAANRLRQGLGQGRLAQARQVLDEQVPPRQQAGQHVLDNLRFAPHRAVRARRGLPRSGRQTSHCVMTVLVVIVLTSWPPFEAGKGWPGGSGRGSTPAPQTGRFAGCRVHLRTRAAPTDRGRGWPSPPVGRVFREWPGAHPRPPARPGNTIGRG